MKQYGEGERVQHGFRHGAIEKVLWLPCQGSLRLAGYEVRFDDGGLEAFPAKDFTLMPDGHAESVTRAWKDAHGEEEDALRARQMWRGVPR